MLIIKEAFDDKLLEQIRVLYEEAFPVSEKKPFSLIMEKRACIKMHDLTRFC